MKLWLWLLFAGLTAAALLALVVIYYRYKHEPQEKYEIAPAHLLQRKYGLYAENRPAIRLDPEKVPVHLRRLIPFAEEWGIGDDIIRSDYERKASIERKRAFYRALSRDDQEAVRKWLDTFPPDSLTEEAAAFMYMALAHDEIRSEVEDRGPDKK